MLIQGSESIAPGLQIPPPNLSKSQFTSNFTPKFGNQKGLLAYEIATSPYTDSMYFIPWALLSDTYFDI